MKLIMKVIFFQSARVHLANDRIYLSFLRMRKKKFLYQSPWVLFGEKQILLFKVPSFTWNLLSACFCLSLAFAPSLNAPPAPPAPTVVVVAGVKAMPNKALAILRKEISYVRAMLFLYTKLNQITHTQAANIS